MITQPRILAFFASLALLTSASAQVPDPFADGRKLFEEKKYADALVEFKKALEYVPDDPSVLSWIAATHINLSQFPEAEKACTTALANGGTAYRLFELLTVAQVRQSKLDDAVATIHKYREIASDAEEQQNDEKLKALEAALHLEKRADCLRRDPPDRDCADAEAEAAWQLHPNDPVQYAQFAQIWLARGTLETDPARKTDFYSRAEDASRTWLAASTEADAVRAKAALGTALVRQRKYEEAVAHLEEARKADPTNCSLKMEVTRAYVGLERFELAKAVATEAIACDPGNPQGYLFRAMAEHGLEDCAGVVKDGTEYMKRSPGKEEPKFLTYCKGVLDYKKKEEERKRALEEYKKWVQQQLEAGPEL